MLNKLWSNLVKFVVMTMRRLHKACTIIMPLILTLALFNPTSAQIQQEENIKTFFDSSVPGIKIQVNATAETKPTQNITFSLKLTKMKDVNVSISYFNFSVYGFLRGQDKVLLNSTSDNNFELNIEQYQAIYQATFRVPENVWGIAYGEITLKYTVKYPVAGDGTLNMDYDLTVGFSMTEIENVYLKSLEEQLNELNQTFTQCFGKKLSRDELLALNETLWLLEQKYELLNALNQTFMECFGKNLTKDELLSLKQEYESLKGVKSELDNTRTVMIFLVVVAVFFVATTAYLVLRKPKGYI